MKLLDSERWNNINEHLFSYMSISLGQQVITGEIMYYWLKDWIHFKLHQIPFQCLNYQLAIFDSGIIGFDIYPCLS